MQYHAFCSSSCSGQGYKKIPVSVLKWTTWSCVLCSSKVTLGSGQFRWKRYLFKKPEEAVCLTKMAQGRRPACCCLSEECLLSGKKRSRELKVTIGLKGPTAIAEDQSGPLFGQVLVPAFGLCFANKEQRSPSGETVLSFANTKLAASLSRCLLFVKQWLFIYLGVGACPPLPFGGAHN